ncbi:MAG: HD domain-containing protein [Magnetococcales bacterium]|nr:HD domain-containing protein [Magnetococcales bacterium]
MRKIVFKSRKAVASPEPPTQKKWKLLVVDDEPDVHAATQLSLSRFSFGDIQLALLHAHSAMEARGLLTRHADVAVALIDVVMETDSAGLDLVKFIREEQKNLFMRLIIRTGQPGMAPERFVIEHYDIDDYKEKTELTSQKLFTTIRNAIKGFRDLQTIAQHHEELVDAHNHAIYMLAMASELKDRETGNHIHRIRHYTESLANRLGLSRNEARSLGLAGMLHDLGKLGIPDQIIQKPGRLTEEEFAVVKTHPEMALHILGEHKWFETAREVAYSHHERWDGSGYPQGLRGEEIPVSARIVAVADVFDALASDRPYKKAWPVEQAVAEIRRCGGTHFDPEVVDAFESELASGAIRQIKDSFPTE